MKCGFAFLAGILLLCQPAMAKDIVVSTAEEFEKAAAVPGDTIVMADGVWRDVKIEFRGNGTAEQPITLRAQTAGKAVLSGQSSLRIVGSHLVVDGLLFTDGYVSSGHVVAFRGDSDEESSDCRLTNTAIVAYNPPDRKSSTWVSLYGARNRVDHCLFQGKANEGPLLIVWLNGQPNRHLIDYNRFCDRTFDEKNGGETIRVGDSKTSMQVSQTTVEHNYFENCDGEIEIISNKSCENIYRHNTFYKNAGTLTLRHGNRCLVEGNYFFGEGKAETGGIRIIGEDHRVINNYLADLAGEDFRAALGMMAGIVDTEANGYFQVKRAVVAFNTVVSCRQSIALSIGAGDRNRTLPPLDSLFANNLIVGSDAPLVFEGIKSDGIKWEANLFYGAAVGLPEIAGIQIVDPKLAKGPNGLLQPMEDSPAIGGAQGNFPEVGTDIAGRPRTGAKDIGCLQPGPEIARFLPLTAAETGPEWKMTAP